MKKEVLYNLEKIRNEESVILVRNGAFYKTFSNDAIILWYFFKYNVVNGTSSFPKGKLYSVITTLNKYNLNVIIINSKVSKQEYKVTSKNKYKEHLKDAVESYQFVRKIDELKIILELKLKNRLLDFSEVEKFLKI